MLRNWEDMVQDPLQNWVYIRGSRDVDHGMHAPQLQNWILASLRRSTHGLCHELANEASPITVLHYYTEDFKARIRCKSRLNNSSTVASSRW